MTSPTSDSRGLGSDSSLKVRCPHCQEEVRIDTNVDWSDVTCHACGSTFGLVGEQTEDGDLSPGDYVGRFELLQRLGQGGFGTVWEALDPQLDRNVALKIPRRGELTAAEAELFLREARAAAQIRHPNIVAVHEVGRDGDRIYLVSDLIQGESLAERLTRDGYSIPQAVELIATLAAALHYVHENHVVHRDLKPANILLDEEGTPYLTDFGLARRVVGDMTLTIDGQIVGTPAYMSPEQARGESRHASPSSDIYSLGVILYQLVTGDVPFRGTPQAIVQQLENEEPRSPRQLNPRISRDLETICFKCLEKEPHSRYQTAKALAEDLRRLQRGEPITARPAGQLSRTVRWARRRPFAAALAVTLALVAVVAPLAALAYRGLAQREALARETAERSERERAEELYVAKMLAVQHAYENNDMIRAGQLLDSLVPAAKESDLRGFEWYYWRQRTRRGLLWELGPFGRLRAVAVAPSGKLLAYGGVDQVVAVKDLPGGELYQRVIVDPDVGSTTVYCLEFSPDSRWLAIGTGGRSIQVMDTATREIVHQLKADGVWIEDIEFSRDGQLLAAAVHQAADREHEGGRVEVWQNFADSTHRVLQPVDSSVRSLAISPDGKSIAMLSAPYFQQRHAELRLVDVETGETLAQRDEQLGRGWGIAFSKDQTELLSPRSDRSTIDVFDATTLAPMRDISGGKSGFGPLAISADGQLLAAGGLDGSLTSWTLPAGQAAQSWPGHLDEILDIAFFPGGEKFVTCSSDGYVKCWELDAAEDARWQTNLPYVRWLQMSHDGNIVYLACADRSGTVVQARHLQKESPLWEIREPDEILESVCLAPDARTLVLGVGNEVRLVDATSGTITDRLSEHRPDRIIMSCSISPNGRWLATGEGRGGRFSDSLSEEIILWDLATREPVHRWHAHDRRVTQILFGPGDDELVTYGYDKHIRRWKIPTGELLAEFRMGDKVARGLALTDQQSTLVAVDQFGAVWRWSLLDSAQQPVMRSREGIVQNVCVNQQDQTLLIPLAPRSGDDALRSMVKFVDMRTWETKMALDFGPGIATSVAMSPAGDTLLAGDAAGHVYRWRVHRPGLRHDNSRIAPLPRSH